MVDVLVTRLLPAVLFGLAAGGLLWLVGLVRKRAALTCAVVLAVVFLAARWQATMLVATQITVTAIAGLLLCSGHRLRMRDVIGLTGASTVVAWGLFAGSAPAYWSAALVGGLVGAAGTWTARAGSTRWSGAPLRLLTLSPAASGGVNGPGIVTGGAAIGAAAADFIFRGRQGLVLVAGAFAAVLTAALVAYLP